jgi:hypothetical protein
MSTDIKLVHTGSKAETLWLKEYLEENGIGVISKNILESSMKAGWARGYPEKSTELYVESFNFDNAKALLDQYFAERNNAGDPEINEED